MTFYLVWADWDNMEIEEFQNEKQLINRVNELCKLDFDADGYGFSVLGVFKGEKLELKPTKVTMKTYKLI